MPLAYLSGLGVMGRRHLKGLIRAGFDVCACDPNPAAFQAATAELVEAGLPIERLRRTAGPAGRFDVAVFAETAAVRLSNFGSFLSTVQADRILLEKPLTTDPEQLDALIALARRHRVSDRTQVNFIRRAWPHVQMLASLCADEERFAVTLNGGAVGLGNLGVHYLDTFLFFAGEEVPAVLWSSVPPEIVGSGRGDEFQDRGAEFVLLGRRGRLLASLEPASSASVVMTVRGAHFIAHVDYTDMRWKVARRRPGSSLPNYRYGADYEVIEDGPFDLPPMDALTEAWAGGVLQMSPLDQACAAHRLLGEILTAGGVRPPYSFA